MADLIDLTALKPPSIILASTGTTGVIKTTASLSGLPGKDTFSGVLTADTYKEIVSFSTSGTLRLVGVITQDATSRTMGLKIVIDGTTVFDSVSPAISANSSGFMGVGITFGNVASAAAGVSLEEIRFNSSLSLQIKSSISETDKIALIHLTTV